MNSGDVYRSLLLTNWVLGFQRIVHDQSFSMQKGLSTRHSRSNAHIANADGVASPRLTRFARTSISHARRNRNSKRETQITPDAKRSVLQSESFLRCPTPRYVIHWRQERQQQTFRWFGAIMWIKVFSFLNTFVGRKIRTEANTVLPSTLMARSPGKWAAL